MTQGTDQDFQRLVLERLGKLDSDITGLKQEIRDKSSKFCLAYALPQWAIAH
jgi:hypothetical protein